MHKHKQMESVDTAALMGLETVRTLHMLLLLYVLIVGRYLTVSHVLLVLLSFFGAGQHPL